MNQIDFQILDISKKKNILNTLGLVLWLSAVKFVATNSNNKMQIFFSPT